MLGQEIINVELTDNMISQVIEDCINLYVRYAYEEGSYLQYSVIKISANQPEIPINEIYDMTRGVYLSNVLDIFDFELSMGTYGSINTLFSPQHVLLYEQAQSRQFPIYGGGRTGVSNSGLIMTEYYVALQYLKQISNTFGKQYTLNYLPASEVIKITPVPDVDIMGVIGLYKKEEAEYLYNQVHVKNLVIGKLKMMWSHVLGKYNTNLPEGTTINYRDIYEDGKNLFDESLQMVRDEAPKPDFFIG